MSVSFDPDETAERLQMFRAHLGLPAEWLTLRARERTDLARMLAAIDFRTIVTDDGEFQHPNLIAILTPDFRLAGYLFGVDFAPNELADAVRQARVGPIAGRSHWRAFLAAALGFAVSAFVFVVAIARHRRASQRSTG